MSQVPFVQSEQILAVTTGYKHPETIAERVLPVVKVAEEKFTYNEISLKDALALPDTKVGRKSYPNEMETGGSEKTDRTDDHAIDDFVANSDLDKARAGYNPRLIAAQNVMRVIKSRQELRVKELIFGAASYDAANTLDITATKFSTATVDPIEIIESAKDTMLVLPNQCTLGRDVFSALRRNPNIVKAKHGTSGDKGLATLDDLQGLFDMEFIIGTSVLDTAKPGQPVSWARMWQNHMAMQYIDKSISSAAENTMTQGFIAHFDDVGAEIADLKRGIKGGTTIRAGHQRKEVLTSTVSGYLLQNAV